MSFHMPALRALAEECVSAAEFGVRWCNSTIALLCGGVHLDSYDVEEIKPCTDQVKELWPEWRLHIGDVLTADVPVCDLMCFDSLHTYDHVRQEIELHAYKAKKYAVFHDTTACGSLCVNTNYQQNPRVSIGIEDAIRRVQEEKDPPESVMGWELVPGHRAAIDELMASDDSWRIKSHDPRSGGLLVLERR